MRKIKVGVLFGGRSVEHEVALQSAKNVISAIDRSKYEVILIGIDKTGHWYLNDATHFLLNEDNPKLIRLKNTTDNSLILVPGETKNQILTIDNDAKVGPIDVIFPVLHGTYGEDGTMQGLLKLAGIPFVGASVLGSAIGMDKDVAKRLLRDGGVKVARFITIQDGDTYDSESIIAALGLPLFVKPANSGSSIGINKVKVDSQLEEAIQVAFSYDRKVLIEEAVIGREIECSVLGNEKPIASIPGEIVPQHEYYSYEAKYIDENGALLQIPAHLPQKTVEEVQTIALKAYRILCCEGMARVDFFLKQNGELLVNEINTIPGFTQISMYPKLWQQSGISYPELIDRLIQLALSRFEKEKNLKTNYE